MAAVRKSSSDSGRKVTGAGKKKWSRKVTEHSHALDIEKDMFAVRSPEKIAASLKRSAIRRNRRKGTPCPSVMSTLNFYINQGEKKLSASRKEIPERVKPVLKKRFQREEK